jgi:hypothetical protein
MTAAAAPGKASATITPNTIIACNFDDSTSLIFVQDGRKKKGEVSQFGGLVPFQATYAELLAQHGSASASHQTAIFAQTPDSLQIQTAGKILLTIDYTKDHLLDEETQMVRYPWTADAIYPNDPQITGGCFGVHRPQTP